MKEDIKISSKIVYGRKRNWVITTFSVEGIEVARSDIPFGNNGIVGALERALNAIRNLTGRILSGEIPSKIKE